MIQPLRRCHRRVFVVMAILLPFLVGWGLWARRMVPVLPDDADLGNSMTPAGSGVPGTGNR